MAKIKFADILEAYDVLSDENKRDLYNQQGLSAEEQVDIEKEIPHRDKEKQEDVPGYYLQDIQHWHSENDEDMISLLEDTPKAKEYYEMITKKFYGENPQFKKNPNTQNLNQLDIVTQINLTFIEAFEGCTKDLVVDRLIEDNTGVVTNVTEIETVRIPHGIQTNQILTLENKGNVYFTSKKEHKTNLHVLVKVGGHDYFTRVQDDVMTNNFITLSQAVLGGEIEILTLSGVKKIKINPGTQHGEKLKIKNLGFPNTRTGKIGNHIIKLNIHLPTKLNSSQRKIFEKLQQYKI